MCLIAFAYKAHPRFSLVVAANRDEFYRRPTAPAGFWPECPGVLAGRDLDRGGTWLGVTRDGRFAALTNYRDPAENRPDARSRGELVRDYLCGALTPRGYLERVRAAGGEYNGFNLLVGDSTGLWHYSNRTGVATAVTPGVHALSNHLLDTPWPKAARAKAGLTECLAGADEDLAAGLFAVLADDVPAPDAALPDTGVGLAWERMLSPVFIASADYGTRSSTVALLGEGGAWFAERTWPGGTERVYRF
ncbi:NRDE family protein [Anaeroselena agilis]|uniref:NRDE family protein n=1 Tax=Anaeroselena agilis TaxID=3063788 RepID=A0ABU3P3P1_9FIRM|nr:NRDE family protein [Selenomonadales bacterium 4137-cl]